MKRQTTMSDTVRIGVIGVGNMGALHASRLAEGKISGASLAAVCDQDAEALDAFSETLAFSDSEALIRSGKVDAVLIATPHFLHTPIAISALKQGLHVMVEKPLAVDKSDALRMLAAQNPKGQVFAAMFNQRTDPYFQKVRTLVNDGTLGKIRRIDWTVTDWFRTAAYYQSSPWRATWKGEGGGVLLNQAVHNIDLLQWIFGLPKKVRSLCQFGRFHDIEVEDSVSAIMEYQDGCVAVFNTSTGEAPGVNRLEIAAENGRLILETNRLLFHRNETPMSEFSASSREGYNRPATWEVQIPLPSHRGGQHVEVLQNFIDAIRFKSPLIAPANEGIHSVELINAILMSGFLDKTISLPISAAAYRRLLKARMEKSTARKSGIDVPSRRSWSKTHDFGPTSR